MLWFFLFVFGVAIGSFLNVVALRYDGEHFLLDPKSIGGRSHCPHCKNTLRWFELIPVLSFIMQGGRCRHCKAKISFQYPIVELLSGIIFVAVPLRLLSTNPQFSMFPPGGSWAWLAEGGNVHFLILSIIFILVFEILLLLSVIDMLLGIIPDELNVALVIIGLFEIFFVRQNFGIGNPSFFGAYAAVFGLQGNIWINHLVAAAFGVVFFGAIVALTRGRGMGVGDVKLALPLGLLFGWPDIVLISAMAFILGGVFGLVAIAVGRKTMKSAIPFGPFLVASATIAFFWGSLLLSGYFHLMGL